MYNPGVFDLNDSRGGSETDRENACEGGVFQVNGVFYVQMLY